MKQFFTFLATVLFTATTFAQVGIGTTTPAASAAFDITSTTKGILIPRMTEAEKNAIPNPATGLMLYQTDGTSGFYFYDGSIWSQIGVNKAYVEALEARIVALEAKQPAEIGDFREGGVVFWVDPLDNTHGLVCALSNYETKVEWGCDRTNLPNVPNVTDTDFSVDGARIGDGMSNTTDIVSDCSNAPAALAAKTLGEEWFLPSISELNEILVNKVALDAALLANGGDAFGSKVYWTSSERSSQLAWAIYFGSVNISTAGKSGLFYYVRAIKAF